jgi:hypothetical protein
MKQKSKNLTINQVINIKKNANPERVFAPEGFKHANLFNTPYRGIVEAFDRRISAWYFEFAKSTYQSNQDSNFTVAALCCIIIDLLSQYIFGKPASSRKIYKQFFSRYLKDCNYSIKPTIINCHYDYKRKGWIEDRITNVAEGFYHCFRCGVVHSARILDYGRINQEFKTDIITLNKWNKGKVEIVVNPYNLLHRLESIFKDYIEKLKNDDVKLKMNFIRKIKLEYGAIIKC